MKRTVPKAFIVYVILLAVSCVFVAYETYYNQNKSITAVSTSDVVLEDTVNETEDSFSEESDNAKEVSASTAVDLLFSAYKAVRNGEKHNPGITDEDFYNYLYPYIPAHGENSITREEFSILAVKLIEFLRLSGLASIQTDAYINDIFYIPDVSSDVMYRNSIIKLYKMGILSGNGEDGAFYPDEPLIYGDAKIISDRIISPALRVKTNIPGNNRKAKVPLAAILQNPELPSGCEITSLTMVLNYLGFDADKCDLADNYLDKGPVGQTNYYDAFIGNPRVWGPHGCFAPVIVKAAKKYLTEKESQLEVYNTTGLCLDELFIQIDQGNPIVIWGTMSMRESYESIVWQINGERVPWIANEHCMVLHGYDRERNVVLIADPLAGNVEYDMDLFNTRFKELFMQSVIIK